ncbi:MAG: 50S ribosomal protein L25/general stress protein Ctc [Desulfotomaculaceae bacterium]|nr:50S ribosomal protein L25/general stress protein Ctc [Desulfotomaculaceae bacterium]
MEAELEGRIRMDRSKASIHQLRENGLAPAVIYGKNMDSTAIAVEVKALQKILRKGGSNALINMKIKENGKTKKYKVLVKDLQYDPVRRNLLHVDFHQISLKDRVHASVPVHLTGIAPGATAGGVLTTLMRRVEVECLATQIPEFIEIDISGLAAGDVITVSDLSLPPGIKVLEEQHAPVVAVTAADRPEEEEPEEKEEPAAETDKTGEENK